jgi:hypothetical protein
MEMAVVMLGVVALLTAYDTARVSSWRRAPMTTLVAWGRSMGWVLGVPVGFALMGQDWVDGAPFLESLMNHWLFFWGPLVLFAFVYDAGRRAGRRAGLLEARDPQYDPHAR